MLYAEGEVPWGTIISAAGGASLVVIGAIGKVLTDLAKARAEAKVTEAKGAIDVEAATIQRWRELFDAAKNQVARLDAHVDELGREMGELRADHEECRADYADLYAAYCQLYDALVKRGDVGLPPRHERRSRRPREEREYRARANVQNTKTLGKLSDAIIRPEEEGGEGI